MRLCYSLLVALLAVPSAAQIAPGDVIITEIMQNPDAVADTDGEYVEVFNTTGAGIDLDGVVLSDAGSDSHTIGSSVTVPAGGFAVLCRNSDAATNGGFTCDYEYSGFTLANTDDEVILTDGATEIDRVAYDGGPTFPNPTGAAMTFTGAAGDDNNAGANWATADDREATFAGPTGDSGSPGTSGSQQAVGSGGGGGQTITLAAAPADGGSIEEDPAGAPRSTSFDVTLTTSDGATSGAEVTVELNLVSGTNAGDFTPTVDGGGVMAPITLTFPVGTASGTAKTVEVTATDDSDVEGIEPFQFALENPTNATVSGAGTFDFSILDDDVVLATDVRINEVRIDQTGSNAEFFELSGTPGALDGLTYLVLGDLSTNGGVIEEATSLDGLSLPADGYFLTAEGSFSLPGSVDHVTTLTFENDDNVTHLLVEGFSGSLGDDLDPDDDGTLDVTPWTSVVDAVGLVDDPDGGDPYYGESLGFDDVGPDGAVVPSHVYRNEATGTWQIGLDDAADVTSEDTPGTANPAAIGQPAFAEVAGYRLLGFPIVTGRVSDLAEINLVQGVANQYGDADPNVYVDYDGTDYVPTISTSADVPSGQGFFMYFFDVDFDPPNTVAGGGTSRSVALAGFDLSIAGTSPTTDVPYTPTTVNGGPADDGAYLLGNPFPEPLDLFGVTQAGGDGTLSRTFQAWDPTAMGGAGDFVMRDGSTDGGTFIDVWQGVLATVVYGSAPSTAPTFSFAIGEIDGAEGGTFPGRRAAPLAVGLDLTGTTASGVAVGDGAADLYFRDGAFVDAAELAPPGGAVARLALVDGDRLRAVLGTPTRIEGVLEVPVAFRATEAGTFTVGFDPDLQAPVGITVGLVDLETGLEHAPGEAVAFDADATDWTERFVLRASGAAVATDGGAPVLAVGDVFPNPTAGGARLALEVDAAQRVTVTVYDALGRAVATAYDGAVAAGAEATVALPDGLAVGAYAVRVTGETFAETRRLVVVR